MSHFNIKSLAFYGVAIGSVLILFKVVSAYGESNLKAPIAIGNRYRLNFTQTLPECLRSTNLVLNIEQSGIYLNGSLLPAEINAQSASTGAISLTGLLDNQQLNLSGSVSGLAQCRTDQVQIQSRIQGENLIGQLRLPSIPGTINFTAQKEKTLQPATNSTSH